MAYQFLKHKIRPLWVTYEESVGTGDGTTRSFKLPDGSNESQRIVIYLDGVPLPSDARIPVMEGAGEPMLYNGKVVLDKDGKTVLSKGRPVLQDREGVKVPVFLEVGWVLSGGRVEFYAAPPVNCFVSCSRIVPSAADIDAEAFLFGKVDPNLMLEIQADRPDPNNNLLKTQEERDAEKKAKEETYRKLGLDARAKKKAEEEKRDKELGEIFFEWITKVFAEIIVGWNVRAEEDGGIVEVPFTQENVHAYLIGDGGDGDKVKATNLAMWLMARATDIMRVQNERTGDLAKN